MAVEVVLVEVLWAAAPLVTAAAAATSSQAEAVDDGMVEVVIGNANDVRECVYS